jgi:putative hydrolase of the HAD superfamily
MNYKLAIVNNGTGLTLSKFKSKLDIDTKFDAFISSAIEGIKKPDAEIYLLSAEKLGVKPNECLFMDDSYKNIEGARQAGMTTLWWDKNKERSEILKEFVNLASIF